MFVFGDPADTARLYLEDLAKNTQGPYLSQAHPDEMSRSELENAMVWTWMAIKNGREDGLEPAVLDVLVEWYDEIFVAVAAVDDRIIGLVEKSLYSPPTGGRDRAKYLKLAREASES